MILRCCFILIFIVNTCQSYSQNGYLYYRDQFRGGVSGDGYSPSAGFGGTGNINISIATGSIIKRAFLFAGRQGAIGSVNVLFNGNNISYNSGNQITSGFFSAFGGNSALHAVDVTQYISPNQTTYQLIVPQQSTSTANRYTDFYLYVAYENNLLSEITTNIYLNEMGFNNDIRYYNISPINKINNNFDVGVAIFSGYLCDTIEGENVYVNNNYLGLIGLSDINSGSCGGTKGSFFYENNSLFGLQDDTANITMTGSDALSEVSAYTVNNDTSISVKFQTEFVPNSTNAIWAIFVTYTSNCSFSTTATALQDTICLGDSVQLNATGGSQYSWFGAFGGLSDSTIANPMATPNQTTTYIVTIKNDSGCVKTEHVKIWVTQPIDSITTTPTICGNATGSITAHFNTNAKYNFTLYDNNFNPLANNTTGVFNQLAAGTYIIENTLHNCTFYDTVMVNAVNNVMANFYSFPQAPWNNPNQPLGKAPMEVSFFNTSQNANGYQWLITQQPNNDTIVEVPVCTGMTSSCGLQHFFTEGGAYEVCLIAYNNQPQCADTSCKTIFIDPNEEISLFIPNVFTPNGDNENDNFVIQLIGAEYLESLEVEVFNRWGQEVAGSRFDVQSLASEITASAGMTELVVWNGTTTAGKEASEGTYFYVVTYTTKAGDTVTEKGTVSLLR